MVERKVPPPTSQQSQAAVDEFIARIAAAFPVPAGIVSPGVGALSHDVKALFGYQGATAKAMADWVIAHLRGTRITNEEILYSIASSHDAIGPQLRDAFTGGSGARPGTGAAPVGPSKALADNGANFDEANRRHAFAGYDGKNHRIEDADYDTARNAYLAAYLAAHLVVPDAPKPPDAPTGGGTTGGPGIG